MSEKKPEIKKESLGVTQKPHWVRIMVFQLQTNINDWIEKDSLYYLRDIEKVKEIIDIVLTKAEESNVNLIVFPELSIPEECVEVISNWSIDKNVVIVAGSHYSNNNGMKTVSKSPVIFNKKVFYTEKIDPAPLELGAIGTEGLAPGRLVYIFKNTPIGNFAVLICSDNLMENAKNAIRHEDLDFWIVPSFQRNSDWHYQHMSLDVLGTRYSRYIIYSNNRVIDENSHLSADGRSAFFGVTNKTVIERFINHGITDNKFKHELVSISNSQDFFILDVDITFKRPAAEMMPADRPNIIVRQIGSLIDEKKNKGFIDKGIAEDKETSVISVLLEKETKEKDTPFINTKLQLGVDYNILTNNEYEKIRKKILQIEQHPSKFNSLVYPNLITRINTSLSEKGIAFVTGPIRIGKTFLLKFIANNFKKKFKLIANIRGEDLKIKETNITSAVQLYFYWLQEIADRIIDEAGSTRKGLSKITRARIEDKHTFLSWLKSNTPPGDTKLQGFLSTIAELKQSLGFYDDDVLIAFHIDDIHAYTSERVFGELREDIINLRDRFKETNNLSIKLIIASRYLPATSLKKQAVNFIPNFDSNIVSTLTKLLSNEMAQNTLKEFNKLILEKTDGYPWFVMRFLKVYLENRVRDEDDNPIELSNKIFEEKSYWTMDTFLGTKRYSEFLEELIILIESSTEKMKVEFKHFISKQDPTAFDLNNGWNNPNDFLIRQSGFFRINTSSDTFENNGCALLKTHFKEEIEPMLR